MNENVYCVYGSFIGSFVAAAFVQYIMDSNANPDLGLVLSRGFTKYDIYNKEMIGNNYADVISLIWTYGSGSAVYSDAGNYVPYTSGSTYNYEIGVKIDSDTERNLDYFGTPVSNKVKLGSYSIASNSVRATESTYTVTVKVYNIPVDQTNIKNKHYTASINVDSSSVSCNIAHNGQVD